MRGLEADVCVIGAGPAGLSLAAGLVAHDVDVLVLESGTGAPDPGMQSLNAGPVLGDPYAGLQATRHRGPGGTSLIWNTPVQGEPGAKCVPLDTADFLPRPGRELTGWPLTREDLDPYYRRALAACGLTEPSFAAAAWTSDGRRPLPGLASPLTSAVYQMATRRALLASTLTLLRGTDGARLLTDATVLRLELDAEGSRVRSAAVGSSDGTRSTVAANRFILAGGAVENARLLLVSGIGEARPGDDASWVGRCFMEHPRDTSLRLRPRSGALYRDIGFYDLGEAADGTPVLGRLALDGEAMIAADLPNASATLLPSPKGVVHRTRRLLGPAGRLGLARRLLPMGGHGWASHPAPGLVYEDLVVLLNLEQSPHPENRIVLASARDAYGVPRAELHWQWRDDDASRLARLRDAVARGLEATGRVTVSVDSGAALDPNAHHHAGTTRMHEDPELGVVDANLRVHGAENLFAAGASTFPTVGFANPLLTVIALSFRLADHLGGGVSG